MDPEELLSLMRRRRTVRDYLTMPIKEDSLNRILEAATLAPSGADILPYTLIIIKDAEMKKQIRTEAEKIEKEFLVKIDNTLKRRFETIGIIPEKYFLTQAPILLVVAGDTTRPYWLESTWIAIAYLVLAIENEGLGSVTYTPSDTGFLRSLLSIPSHLSPEVILPIGYPVKNKPSKIARPEGKIFYEKYEG